MRVRLRHVTLTRAGKRATSDEIADVDVLTIGRGTDNRLHLPGLTVPLRHSRIRGVGTDLHVEPVEPDRLAVNGRAVGSAVLRPGDVMDVGTFALRVLAPEGDEVLLLVVEEVRRSGPEAQELLARSHLGIERGLLARRPLAWLAFAGVLAGALVVPLVLEDRRTARPHGDESPRDLPQRLWSTGPLTRAHARLATRCVACHAARFTAVSDDACVACHAATARHTAADREQPALATVHCTDCHREHRGAGALRDVAAATCVACHGDARRLPPSPTVRLVRAFAEGDAHPELSVLAPTQAGSMACTRLPVAAVAAAPTRSDPLVERGGLRFPHALHLQPGLRNRWDAARAAQQTTLVCGDCHRLDATGRFMQPVTFARDCQSCHDLAFSERDVARQAPHPAQPDVVRTQVLEFFARAALGPDAPAVLPTRQRPGRDLGDAERAAALRRAETDAGRALDDLLGLNGVDSRGGSRGACSACHVFTPQGRVLPVVLAGASARCQASRAAVDRADPFVVPVAGRWMPRAVFDHAAHRTEPCIRCHDVATAAGPTGMLPGKSVCLPCHRADAAFHAIGSLADCGVCHRFHQPEHGPLRPASTRG